MSDKPRSRRVPTGRIVRATQLGGLAGRVATSVLSKGAVSLLKGERPTLSSLVLTPANLTRLTNQLAKMRGAAMKVGQLLSMDAGDLLPGELSAILSRLQQDADPMPKEQVKEVLTTHWGKHWQDGLLYFSFAPVAAASIGQVHKVITLDGTMLAVKIQYPGITKSIDSDVDNVASLIRLSGLLPKDIDFTPLFGAAKAQLHEEADYRREAAMLECYQRLLGERQYFVCPTVYAPMTTTRTLAMSYMNGSAITEVENEPQAIRNTLMSALMTLFFEELFEFRLMQSDPNLANYRYNAEARAIQLLDFGATREIPPAIAEDYRQLLNAAASQDRDAMLRAAVSIGLLSDAHSEEQKARIVDMGMLACESLHADGGYDFGQSDLVARLHVLGTSLTRELDFWHVPPADALFIHRKLGGLFLLAKRWGAQVDMRAAAAPWLFS